MTVISFFPSTSVNLPANFPSVFVSIAASLTLPAMTTVAPAVVEPETNTSSWDSKESVSGLSIVMPNSFSCGVGVHFDDVFDVVNLEKSSDIFGKKPTIFGPTRSMPVIKSPMPNPIRVASNASLFITMKYNEGRRLPATPMSYRKSEVLLSISKSAINCKCRYESFI